MQSWITHAAALIICAATADAQNVSGGLLRLVQTIPLPGVEGRIDHFAVDLVGRRLFVCALGNNTLDVIDLEKGTSVNSIEGLASRQDADYVPEASYLCVANDKRGICNFYDGKSFALLGSANFKDDADNVRYDNVAKRIYVGFGNGGLGILDAGSRKSFGSIKLSGHPEAFVLERNGPRIFANVPDAGHVAVIDRNKGEVIATWKTDSAAANFPMVLDEANHRLLIGCRVPSRLVVLNTESGEVVARTEISGDPDDLFYDSKRHRIYAICGAGAIDIIEQTSANTYKALAKVDTANGARTGLFVPEWNNLFVAVPHRGNQGAEIRCYQVK
jgi:DNA-binding beta-propeller fold protein YncE